MIVYWQEGGAHSLAIADKNYEAKMSARVSGREAAHAKYHILSEAVIRHKRILRRDLKKLYRALRHFDEVGISNELAEFVESHLTADWIAFGSAEGEEADLSAMEV